MGPGLQAMMQQQRLQAMMQQQRLQAMMQQQRLEAMMQQQRLQAMMQQQRLQALLQWAINIGNSWYSCWHYWGSYCSCRLAMPSYYS
jgi:hypothetical protein